MKITGRQEQILDRIVNDYIDLAKPISSEFLEKKHDFRISPATIRIEMQKLTSKGYLFQPHTSAGRIPTDKGYRFFVDHLFKGEIPEFEDLFEIENIFQKTRKDIFKLASRLTRFLAEQSSSFTILNLLGRGLFWKEGWKEILKEPEFKEKDIIFDFAELLENFEKNIKDLKINSEIKIYIGKESPFKKAKDFSIISSKCCLPNEEEALLSLLGPKRMPYQRNISLINSLVKILSKY